MHGEEALSEQLKATEAAPAMLSFLLNAAQLISDWVSPLGMDIGSACN